MRIKLGGLTNTDSFWFNVIAQDIQWRSVMKEAPKEEGYMGILLNCLVVD